jgi:hypothetical protein
MIPETQESLMRRLIFALSAILCLLTAAARVPAQEVAVQPEVVDLEFVKGLAVSGTLTQSMGSFSTYIWPAVGDTFEIDLANLPRESLRFKHPEDAKERPYIPIHGLFNIEQIERNQKNQGANRIHLAAIKDGHKLLLQITAPELVKGGKARMIIYSESYQRIMAVAAADCVLIERADSQSLREAEAELELKLDQTKNQVQKTLDTIAKMEKELATLREQRQAPTPK